MINSKGVKRFCSEDISEIENYEQAIADTVRTWHCHHRREIDENKTRTTLIAEKLYWNRPASELIFLTKAEHIRLHRSGKPLSAESCKKISMSLSGEKNPMFGKSPWNRGKHLSEETKKKLSLSHSGEKNPMFGKHRSEETRKKLSMALSGKHLSEETRKKISLSHSREKNPAFGQKWWNNGAECVRSRECPGEGWVRGRLKRK